MWRASTLPSQFWFLLQWCWCSSWSFSSAFQCKFQGQGKWHGAYCFGVCFSTNKFVTLQSSKQDPPAPWVVFSTVRQHDWRICVWQPRVWDGSKYGCHEPQRRGISQHHRPVLINPAIPSFHPSSITLTWSAEQIKGIWTVIWLNSKQRHIILF